jgi:hypothetical protein
LPPSSVGIVVPLPPRASNGGDDAGDASSGDGASELLVATEFDVWLVDDNGKGSPLRISDLLRTSTKPVEYAGTASLFGPRAMAASDSPGRRRRSAFIHMASGGRDQLTRVCEVDLDSRTVCVVAESCATVFCADLDRKEQPSLLLTAGPLETDVPEILCESLSGARWSSSSSSSASPLLPTTPTLPAAVSSLKVGASVWTRVPQEPWAVTTHYPRACIALGNRLALYRESPEHPYHYPYGIGTSDNLGATYVVDMLTGARTPGPRSRILWNSTASSVRHVADAKSHLVTLCTSRDCYSHSNELPFADSNRRLAAYETWCWRPGHSTAWTLVDADRVDSEHTILAPVLPLESELPTLPRFLFSVREIPGPTRAHEWGREPERPSVLWRRVALDLDRKYRDNADATGDGGGGGGGDGDCDGKTADFEHEPLFTWTPTVWVLAHVRGHMIVCHRTKGESVVHMRALDGVTKSATVRITEPPYFVIAVADSWIVDDPVGLIVPGATVALRGRDGALLVSHTNKTKLVVGALSPDLRIVEWAHETPVESLGHCAPRLCPVP